MFVIAPGIDTETLLAHACESLASASVMASDFAGFLEGSQRNTMLGIAQVIMLGELAVNRALDNLDPYRSVPRQLLWRRRTTCSLAKDVGLIGYQANRPPMPDHMLKIPRTHQLKIPTRSPPRWPAMSLRWATAPAS